MSNFKMLAIVGFVYQLKITHDSYKTSLKLKDAVESKFQKAYKEYILLKQKLEKILDETNEAYKDKRIELFKNNLEDAEYEYKNLCDKIKSIENDICFTPEEMPVFPKIVSPILLFGNLCVFAYEFYSSINQQSTLSILSKCSLISFPAIILGILGVYFAYNTRAVNEKLEKVQSEMKIEINKIKNKLNLIKRNEFYFSN